MLSGDLWQGGQFETSMVFWFFPGWITQELHAQSVTLFYKNILQFCA